MQATINNSLLSNIKPGKKPYEIRDTKLKGFILRVQPTGSMSYLCQYTRGKRVSIGKASVMTPTQARDEARKIIFSFIKGEDPRAAAKASKVYDLESFLARVYGPWIESHHKRGASTISMIRAAFPELKKTKLDKITVWNIEKWRTAQLKAGTKPASVNRYVGALKAALTKATEWNYIKVNPIAGVKPVRVESDGHVRYLSDSEEQALRQALDEREKRLRGKGKIVLAFADNVKPLVLLSLNTGMRRGELLGLEWADVDLGRETITVRADNAKNGKARHIPLNQEALETLQLWKTQANSSVLVFPGTKGQRLVSVKRAWENVLDSAGIENFRWHDMRHHFASRLVMAGVDLNMVRELLGHGDIKMTLRYAHLAPEAKAEAVARLNRS